MKAATHPLNEARLEELQRLNILDTPREEEFDDIVEFISQLCDAPISVINLIDRERQWFKAEVGLGVRSTPLDTSLCSHVILENEFVEICDTLADTRTCDNELCLGSGGFRFYAGALLKSRDGLPVGTLCVLDTKPRSLTPMQRRALELFAHRIMREFELRVVIENERMLRREIDHRVKNSLASVSAIIGLQQSRAQNPETIDSLGAIRARISALSSLHGELQQGDRGDQVNLASFLQRASRELSKLIAPDVVLEVDTPAIMVGSSTANSVALILNEFVTNSAKHGFGDGGGRIVIAGRLDNDLLTLNFRDDGVADEQVLDKLREGSGLGYRIISAAAASVGGTVEWSCCNPGLAVKTTMPLSDR